ncbi:MAG: hypothetical protein WC455_26805 [Dehalococcoidia bacterium]
MVDKKNPDYSKSAKSITNAPETIEAYNVWLSLVNEVTKADEVIQKCIPADLKETRDRLILEAQSARDYLESKVKEYGGYQDTVTGQYALIIEAKRPQYDAKKFETAFPRESPIVIEKAVNEKALDGLIKGGILTEADLVTQGVITYKITERKVIQ